ncbi:sulfite exporter TauE/SafE family protein [Desulfopila inferna]|uniref:sulfite exporter TauE/SafE family protein n=1 Tax=Desulfopila inferna TaxID=468528 RepID=UPI0019633E3D|nr:sulfite exporter TauE/SafE family protein [Desulfopila inferna]MBM9604993.1 sulfite exporter TauE/SafE family protein [Desulfopila inferna]
MKFVRIPFIAVLTSLTFLLLASYTFAQVEVTTDGKAGDIVTIKGSIQPGEELYLAVAQQDEFQPSEANMPHEESKFAKETQKGKFGMETSIPPLYYILTTNPTAFGKRVDDTRFGGPSVFLGKGRTKGLYSTYSYLLKDDFDTIDETARAGLGPISSSDQWNFLKWANETAYGINTIVKEGNRVGKIVIFSRTVLQDESSGNYWDKGTSIDLDKSTGNFTASFKSFRHTPPGTGFDVYVNGTKAESFSLEGKGFWLKKGYRYMNPLWIVIGAILVGTYFSMIGAAGGMLMAAFQVLVVNTMGPVGVNAANVLKPSNMALTLFSPLGSFYRFAVVEKRVAWPVGISFGVGIFIGSIWLGKYVSALLPMQAYKEWLAVLVVIMGIKTLTEMTPKAMNKRKNIKAMTQKFNAAVKKAKETGEAMEMGSIEPVKTGLMDYRFKFWGEEFRINPLLFAFLGILIGIVSRSFGIGGGFLLVPAMTTLGALPMYVAVPISLIGTCFSSIGSFVGYAMIGYWPDWVLAGAIIIGGFAGGMLGSRAQKLFSEMQLKVVLALTLFFLFFRFFKIEVWI